MPSENNRRIAKNTLLLYIRMFVTMLIGFYTTRVVLNVLGVIDYGIYNVVGGIVSSLAVLNGSMASATQRWITIALGKEDKNYLKKVFGVGMTAHCIMAGLVFLLIETIGLWYLYTYAVIPEERMNTAFWTFQISTLTMALSIINIPFQGVIIAHERMSIYALFSIFDVVMKLVTCLALYFITIDKLLIYASLLFLTFFIHFLCIQVYCHTHFIEATFHLLWDKKIYKEMWILTFWNMSDNVAYIGYSNGTTLLINLFFGPVMNAAVGIANQASNIINHFSINFQTALNPQITKNYAQKEYQEMHKLMFRSSKFSCFMMLFLAVPLFYETHFILELWLGIGNIPEHTIFFMRLGLFCSILMAIRNPLKTAAIANGHLKKYQFVVNGILLLICPTLYLLYKLGAIAEFSGIIFILFMSISMLASAYILQRMISLNFNEFIHKVLLVIIKTSLLCFIIPGIIYILMPESVFRVLFLTITSSIVTTLVIYYTGLESKEQEYAQYLIQKLRYKIKVPYE